MSSAPPRLVAAIDVGTNTIRMLVARLVDGAPHAVASASSMTGLGAGLGATGRISDDGLDAAERTLRHMVAEARALNADDIMVACTAIARDASNADELLERIRRATGAEPRVLSGTEEANLTFLGLLSAGASEPLIAGDLGGGSLEMMGGRAPSPDWAVSLPLGVRLLTERFAPGDPASLDLIGPIVAHARQLIDPVASRYEAGSVVMAGGTALALARLAKRGDLDRDALVGCVELLAAKHADDVAVEAGIEPDRVRMCFAGAGVVEAVRRAFGVESIVVSPAGLREGLVMEACI
ncbi:MAG: hypothetical protein KDC33_11465 [Thermoleophilia bacterium]|nr:hypothetical protein [Thermoleophilia bacterium]